VTEAIAEGAAAAICATEVTDTVKVVARCDGRSIVVDTLDRSSLVAVQTPQAFAPDVLRAAHASGGDATDDAGLVEALGGTVVVVPRATSNVKITNASDLDLIRASLS
jgi:2-C-methyl-D-erythritol 4-phosphate cytidylyltransferase